MTTNLGMKLLVAASVLSFGAAAPVFAGPNGGSAEFITGGVGLEARQAMLAQAGQYNLQLEFAAAPEGEYLSEVEVNVSDARGNAVLSTRTDGPLLLARLPAGTYSVAAKHAGTTRTQQLSVGQGRRHVVMRFPALDKVMADNSGTR